MNAATTLAAFAAALVVVFGGAALAGAAIGPGPSDDRPPAVGQEEHSAMTASADPDHGAAARPLRGLAVAEDGLRVVVDDAELRRGRVEELRFRIVDDRGQAVRDFDVEHEKRMHLILVRRDLTGFRHLHPELTADGSWRSEARLDTAGSYRLFADFSHAGQARTLASDLRVDGPADLRPLAQPAAAAVSDGGYVVRLDTAGARPGRAARMSFTITKGGEPVRTDPYLGAGGHLVALRDGDLAFLHVHPAEDDSVEFEVTFPTAGRYRLFLQFEHDGRVETVAFTQEVS